MHDAVLVVADVLSVAAGALQVEGERTPGRHRTLHTGPDRPGVEGMLEPVVTRDLGFDHAGAVAGLQHMDPHRIALIGAQDGSVGIADRRSVDLVAAAERIGELLAPAWKVERCSERVGAHMLDRSSEPESTVQRGVLVVDGAFAGIRLVAMDRVDDDVAVGVTEIETVVVDDDRVAVVDGGAGDVDVDLCSGAHLLRR